MNLDRITFGWAASSYFGWGVLGLNWMLHWPGVALSAMPDLAAELPPDDERGIRLSNRLRQSVAMQREMPEAARDHPAFVALGNDFESQPVAGGRPLEGSPTIAIAVFEDLVAAEQNVERLREYPMVLSMSEWSRRWLSWHGIEAPVWHTAYDPVLFHPGVRRKYDDGRFRVFSGGKAEYRKGQDIVIEAFARFAEHHDDAVLVAAWGSPWPGMAKSLAQSRLGAPPGAELGMPNFRAWIERAGVKPHQIEIVPPLPNWRMAEVYGGVDCAVFPNRCESATNQVAMECMACGVPTALRGATGQFDLPESAAAWILTEGDDPEFVEEGLEALYGGRTAPAPLGPEWAWPASIEKLTGILGDAGL